MRSRPSDVWAASVSTTSTARIPTSRLRRRSMVSSIRNRSHRSRGRSWNYVSLGHGNSYRSWLDILTALRDVGYDDVVSIENEDYSLDADTAISTSASVLKFCIRALSSQNAR